MKLSSKSDYCIRALVDLAQNRGRGPVPSSEIAARQAIPASLVGQVLGTLRLAGFVRSARGAQGGHELARDPASIRLDAVVEALEGPGLLSPAPAARNGSVSSGARAQAPVWVEVRHAVRDVLAGHTLADLACLESSAGGRYSI